MTRILIVDDSTVMHAYYRQVLGALRGCRLTFAKHGEDAFNRISADGDPDVIVLDINMPVMDGLEFLRRLRSLPIRRPAVIIVSTEDKPDDLQRGLEAGADDYLCKPFKPEQLQELVRSYLPVDELPAVDEHPVAERRP